MSEKEFQRLINNLELEEDGEEIARLINGLLARDQGDLLRMYLTQAHSEVEQSEQETELTPRQEAALRVVRRTEDPVSAGDLTELVDAEFADVGEDFQSLRHRSHASDILNRLVEAGLLGKMRYQGTVYYVEPDEAVRTWVKQHGGFDDIDLTALVEETELPLNTVKEVLTRL